MLQCHKDILLLKFCTHIVNVTNILIYYSSTCTVFSKYIYISVCFVTFYTKSMSPKSTHHTRIICTHFGISLEYVSIHKT